MKSSAVNTSSAVGFSLYSSVGAPDPPAAEELVLPDGADPVEGAGGVGASGGGAGDTSSARADESAVSAQAPLLTGT